MKSTRKAVRFPVLLCLLVLCLAGLVSCGGGKEVLGLAAIYQGPEITTTDHEFTKDDFYVVASYTDGSFLDPVPDKDYTLEQVGLKDGFYIFHITYGGYTQEAYVKCDVPIFPSDLEGN